MRHGKILMGGALVLVLQGCSGFVSGGLEIEALPAEVAAPCPQPGEFLAGSGSVADDEIAMGRIGDALIACGQQKAAAVAAYDGVRHKLRSQ